MLACYLETLLPMRHGIDSRHGLKLLGTVDSETIFVKMLHTFMKTLLLFLHYFIKNLNICMAYKCLT